MKNISNFLTFVFYLANFILIIFYLYPGSLFGCLLYNDCKIEPHITMDFIISSNHFFIFAAISTLGILVYKNSKKMILLILYLFLLSITLELLHFFIPIRVFELKDLFGNILGVLFVIIIYKVKVNNA